MQSLPIGTIVMYDGANWMDNVTLTGWYACTGSNAAHGCPDLQSRFIKGGTVGETGGSNERALSVAQLPAHSHGIAIDPHSHSFSSTAHSHSFSSSTPSHSHSFSGSGSVSTAGQYYPLTTLITYAIDGHLTSTNVVTGLTSDSGGSSNVTISGTTGSGGGDSGSGSSSSESAGGSVASATATASSSTAGSSQPFDNQPAYYSVIFVRKCYEPASEGISENFDDSGTVTDPAISVIDGGDIETAFTFRDAGRL